MRQWAAVAAIPTLASDKPAELAVKALVRAQFCERLAKLRGLPEDGSAFMIGLFSHLDAMLDLPICEALSRVHLNEELTAILLESDAGGNPLAEIFQVVRDYESALWEAVTGHAARLRLTTTEVTQAYAESTFWTAQAAQWTSRKHDTRSKNRRVMSGEPPIMAGTMARAPAAWFAPSFRIFPKPGSSFARRTKSRFAPRSPATTPKPASAVAEWSGIASSRRVVI